MGSWKNTGKTSQGKVQDSSDSFGAATRIVKSLDDTANRWDKSNKGFTDDLAKILSGSINKYLEGTHKSDDEREETFEKLDKLSERHLSKSQIIGKSLIDSFKVIGGYIVNRYESAGLRIIDNYNQNLTNITVRQQWSNAQYTKELKDATNWMKNGGLTKQFSQIDWTASLQKVMSTGLRDTISDDIASRLAFQNLISEKLLPYINTNTRSYVRYSKLLDNSFGEAVVAISKYTEGIYGAEGLEQDALNSQIDQFRNIMLLSGDTKEQGLQNLEAFTTFYQEMAAKLGPEQAEKISSLLYDQYTAAPGSGNIMVMGAGVKTPQDVIDLFASGAEGLDLFLDKLNKEYTTVGREDPNVKAVMGTTGIGFDRELADALEVYNKYGGKLKDLPSAAEVMKGYDRSAVYNSKLGELKDNWYQSKDAQALKYYENATANIADTLAEKVADVPGKLASIEKLINIWFGAWTLYMSSKAVSDIFGSANPLGARKAKVFGQFGQSLPAEGGVGGLSSGSLLSGVGALSVASIAAGLVMAGHSGISAMNDPRMQGNKAAAFGLGAISGNASTYGYSDIDKLTVAKERSKNFLDLDWGKVGKSAAAGGLIGAGVGTAVGGWALGSGTAIGAGVGAATGALTSAATQWAEMQDYNRVLKKGLGKFSDAVGETVENINKDIETLQDVTSLKDSIATLKEDLKDTSDMTALEIAQKKHELSIEERLLDIKLKELNADGTNLDKAAQDAEALLNNAENLASFATNFEKGTYNSMDEFMDFLGVSDFSKNYKGKIGNAVTSDNYDTILTKLGGMESVNSLLSALGKDQLVGDTASKENKKILTNLLMSMADTQGLKGATKGRNYGDLTKIGPDALLEIAGDAQTNAQTALSTIAQAATIKGAQASSNFENINDYYKMMRETLAAVYATSKPADFSKKSTEELISDVITGATAEEVTGYLQWLSGVGDSASWTSSAWASSSRPRFFNLGTDYVQNDLMPALLHKGEAVLTSASANKLRELAEGAGGLSAYISELYKSKNAGSAIPENVTVSLDPVVDAIKTQTDELQESLGEIITLITSLIPDPLTTATHNLSLISYRGA